MHEDHYLQTPEGQLAQYRRRGKTRTWIKVDRIEPRSKHAMPDSEKDEFQRKVLESLTRFRRRAFRGAIALDLSLNTTEKTPSYAHTIAKNLLDLLARPRENLDTLRRGLLYFDDAQVHALSVSCSHGEQNPGIFITASPLQMLLEDLDLAVRATRELENHRDESEQSERFDSAIEDLADLLRNEADNRRLYGDRDFELHLKLRRREAQEQLLGRSKISTFDLRQMFGVPNDYLSTSWERVFNTSPLRVVLAELPQVDGASKQYEQEIESKLRQFQTKYGWIINPLLVPVALEVVVKPPPMRRQRGVHDLDNVLRDYLIPRVVDVLKPPSHPCWTLRDPDSFFSMSIAGVRLPKPPTSTRIGLMRYEAWRLPPAKEDSRGFVSVAIVTDAKPCGGVFHEIDQEIERWGEVLEDDIF
jgi:hypothetical protein